MPWRPLDESIEMNLGGRIQRDQQRLGQQGNPIKVSPVRAHHGPLAREISREMNRTFEQMTDDGFAFRTVWLEDGTRARLVIQNGVERLEAIGAEALDASLPVDTLILEHGILTSASTIALSTALIGYYASTGTREPGGAEDHLYGYADEIAAPDGSVQWSSVTAPADHDPTLATQELLDNFFILFTDSLAIATQKRNRLPSLWTGLARWLAQIWGPYRDVCGNFPPSDRPWIPSSMPDIVPQKYGLVRDVDTSTTPPTLSYWMVFVGGTGGFGGTGESAIGANAVAAIRCTIPTECQTWADALVAGVLPATHPTTPGAALTEAELEMYEAAVLAGLEIADGEELVTLIADIGAESGTPWSFRAHGWQWAPIILGDLDSAQWECQAYQWRWSAPDSVAQDWRIGEIDISFSAGSPSATISWESGTVCWPSLRVSLWLGSAGGASRVLLLDSNATPDRWQQAIDAAGPLYLSVCDDGTWKRWEYEGSQIIADNETLVIGDDGSKMECGSVPSYYGETITIASANTSSAFGITVEYLSGASREVRSGSIWTNGNTWNNVDGGTPETTMPPADCEVIISGSYTCQVSGYPITPVPHCLTDTSTDQIWYYPTCDDEGRINSYGNWKATGHDGLYERKVYDADDYKGGGLGLWISPTDPTFVQVFSYTEEVSGDLNSHASRSASGLWRLDEAHGRRFHRDQRYCAASNSYFVDWYEDVPVAQDWAIGFSPTWGGLSNSVGTGDLSAVEDADIGQAESQWTGGITTYIGGQAVAAEAVTRTDSPYLGEPFSPEHVRVRTIWHASDGPPWQLALSMADGLGSAGGDAIYQRWVGDDVQAEGGYVGIGLASRFIGVS